MECGGAAPRGRGAGYHVWIREEEKEKKRERERKEPCNAWDAMERAG
jgi:hypothetical protein